MTYEPSNVTDELELLTSKASLQLDLALAAVSLHDTVLAKYVQEMEKEVDEITNQLFIHTMLSARSPKEATENLLFIHVGNLVNFISDISSNIAEIVFDGNPFKDRNNIFLYMHEFVDKAVVAEESILVGKCEEDLQIQQLLGIDIMALKHDNEIILGYQHDFQVGDTLYLRGPSTNVAIFSEVVRGHIKDYKVAENMLKNSIMMQSTTELRTYEQKLLKIINFTTLMIDLGILGVINPQSGIKNTLVEYEKQIDDLLREFQKDLLKNRRADIVTEEETLGLLKLSSEFEMISDAILTVGLGMKATERSYMHSVMKEAMATAEDDINTIVIKRNSPYIGKTVHEVEMETEYSGEVFDIELIKRKNTVIPFPDEKTRIEVGDMLVVKSYHNSEALEDEDEEEEDEEELVQAENQRLVHG